MNKTKRIYILIDCQTQIKRDKQQQQKIKYESVI